MLGQFKEYIINNLLFSSENKILLAVSGGVDSMVMFKLFIESDFNISVAHCNFSLRGEESDGDEEFVGNYVSQFNCSLHTKKFETKEYADINGISIEMAARELRYNYFNELCQNEGCDFIATAHHQDDQIETFFLNMSRKSGIRGLSGIKPKSGKLVRPLLFASREMILNYAAENNIPYREDSSNSSVEYKRNYIRHKILPLFSEINPSYRDNFISTIKNLKEVEEVFQDTINLLKDKVTVENEGNHEVFINRLLNSKFPKILLFEILNELHFNSSVIDQVFESLSIGTGKQFFSPTHRAVIDREKLIVTKIEEPGTHPVFYIEKGDLEIYNPLNIEINRFERRGYKIPQSSLFASLDFDKLFFPLTIRKWEKGEYFQPLGMDGYKKLSDFFIDEKFSIPEKENTWILYSGNKVAWIIGHRIDNRFKITADTRVIYQLRIIS